MPRTTHQQKVLSARQFLYGKELSSALLALTEQDMRIIQSALGAGSCPKSLAEAIREIATSGDRPLEPGEIAEVTRDPVRHVNLHSLLADEPQQKFFELDDPLIAELEQLLEVGKTTDAVAKLQDHLDGLSPEKRGNRRPVAALGLTPTASAKSDPLAEAVKTLPLRLRSRPVLCSENRNNKDGSLLFSACENGYKLTGTVKKNVQSAGRLMLGPRADSFVSLCSRSGVSVVPPTGGAKGKPPAQRGGSIKLQL
uniref:Methyltransferase n=1 Tax=Erysiphe necator associated polymycovirus 1 TaxID=2742555 RepID=A0A8E3YX70_9VIRU|nr:methyltransferase [Erysiphe necator associated polymycovirus 1]